MEPTTAIKKMDAKVSMYVKIQCSYDDNDDAGVRSATTARRGIG